MLLQAMPSVVGPDGKLTPDAIADLRLSEKQAETLNISLETCLEQIKALEAQAAVLVSEDGGQYYKIPGLSEQAEDLIMDLADQTEVVLPGDAGRSLFESIITGPVLGAIRYERQVFVQGEGKNISLSVVYHEGDNFIGSRHYSPTVGSWNARYDNIIGQE